MPQIFDDLYQFTSYAPPIDLTFHQYLLNIDEPILIHTGSRQQAQTLLPQIKDVLMGRKLKYIFVSHFESDECGGLEIILKDSEKKNTIILMAIKIGDVMLPILTDFVNYMMPIIASTTAWIKENKRQIQLDRDTPNGVIPYSMFYLLSLNKKTVNAGLSLHMIIVDKKMSFVHFKPI